MVGDATQRLYDLGKQPTAGRVVAELSYGYWVGLANAYDTTLWRTDLHRIFTPRIEARRALHETLDRLRTLRNRIAHHEPIFQRKLSDDYARIRMVLGCLSPSTLAWLDHHSTRGRSSAPVGVPAALAVKPDEVTEFKLRRCSPNQSPTSLLRMRDWRQWRSRSTRQLLSKARTTFDASSKRLWPQPITMRPTGSSGSRTST
jgi:hypothetical protein